MEPLLELRHVSYAYHSKNGETYALSDLSFQVQRGEFIAIVGPSGCGKSTLLSLISGLLRAESGAILLSGKEKETFQKNTGYMLQKDHLFEWRSIYRNVILGLEIQGRLDEKSKERVENMLADYGLARFRDARPSQLSGGMRQLSLIHIFRSQASRMSTSCRKISVFNAATQPEAVRPPRRWPRLPCCLAGSSARKCS